MLISFYNPNLLFSGAIGDMPLPQVGGFVTIMGGDYQVTGVKNVGLTSTIDGDIIPNEVQVFLK